MLPQDMAWNIFKKTGTVDAYLNYLKNTETEKKVTDGVNNIEHQNERNNSETNQLQ